MTNSKQTLTLAERRFNVLRESGIAERRRLTNKPPTGHFYTLLLVVLGLVLLGLLMVLSSSSITFFHAGESALFLFQKQATWACLGAIAMWVTYRLPYLEWRRFVKPVLAVSYASNFLVFLPGLGKSVNGARAWVNLGPMSFQPSEFLKLAVVLFCADLISKRHREVLNTRRTLVPSLLVVGSAALICMGQHDFGSALIFGGMMLAICFIAGMSLVPLAWAAGFFGAAGALVLYTSSRARGRLLAFLDIEGTKGTTGYQVYQSLLSIANGGPTGVGVGQGSGKWGYLPLSYSDFIFAIVAEELGIVGSLAVLGGFIAITVVGIHVALRARELFGALLAGGITAWLAIQAFVNIGGVTASLPVTGLTLPFISYGGSSLLVSMAAAGMLLNVARNMK